MRADQVTGQGQAGAAGTAGHAGDLAATDPGADEAAVDAVLTASRTMVAVATMSLGTAAEETTIAQYRALVVLASRGPQRLVDLAGALGVMPSTAGRMCDRLVRKGLIRRHRARADRRAVQLSITAAGRDVVDQATARRRELIAEILARLPAGRQAAVADALRAFTEAAGEIPDSRWPSSPPEACGSAMATSPPVVRAAATGAAKLLRVRWLVRAPIWAYRARLGAVFGSRLVMLEHTGRTSGRRRFVVLEVAGHPAPGTYLVVSGFGGRAQWFRNIQANPRVRLYAASRRPAPPRARILTRDKARTALAAYAAARPRAWATLKPALEKTLGAEAGNLPMVPLDLAPGAAAQAV